MKKILVVGVGGAGINIVNMLLKQGYKGQVCIMDTDICHAQVADYHSNRVFIGYSETRGLGGGGYVELGKRSAIADAPIIRGALCGLRANNPKKSPKEIAISVKDAKSRRPDAVIICTGLGGGTGSGASPEIAKIAKEMGCFVAAFAVLPFSTERNRVNKAKEAHSKLEEHCDSLVTFDQNKIIEIWPKKKNFGDLWKKQDVFIVESVISYVSMIKEINKR